MVRLKRTNIKIREFIFYINIRIAEFITFTIFFMNKIKDTITRISLNPFN
jgi:hypothetical protein